MAFYTSDSDQCCCSAACFFHYAGKTAGDDTGQAYRSCICRCDTKRGRAGFYGSGQYRTCGGSVLSRRFKTTQEHEPDTCYVFTFQDGRELKIGVYENDIYYDGQWYTGAASTPDLFRSMTGSRFFVIETTMPETESTAE